MCTMNPQVLAHRQSDAWRRLRRIAGRRSGEADGRSGKRLGPGQALKAPYMFNIMKHPKISS